MSPIFAIDPGTFDSAFVVWDGTTIRDCDIIPNGKLLEFFPNAMNHHDCRSCAIEMVASYGMAVGKEVFETCVWIGRFAQCWDEMLTGAGQTYSGARLIYRRDIKMHHCGNMHAKDANVAQALRDKYGEKGTKKNPGVTYALKSHLWQAFALATYVTETQPKEPNAV